jgi:AbrB family looped-hinge helix DNA binding protein
MTTEVILTGKGQVVIPKPLREALGLHPGDRLVFRRVGEALFVYPLRQLSVGEALEKIPGSEAPFPGFDVERAAVEEAYVERRK